MKLLTLPLLFLFITSVIANEKKDCNKLLSLSTEYKWNKSIPIRPGYKSLDELMSEATQKFIGANDIQINIKENKLVLNVAEGADQKLEIPGTIFSIQFANNKSTFLSVVTENAQLSYKMNKANEFEKINNSKLPTFMNDGIYTFKIVVAEKNPFDSFVEAKDPMAQYSVDVMRIGDRDKMRGGPPLRYKDFKVLFESFGVSEVKDLVGKKYSSRFKANYTSLTSYMSEIKLGKDYTPPSLDNIYNQILDSLKSLKQPKFENIDIGTLTSATALAFEDEKWIELLSKRLSNETNKKITLVEADIELFSTRVRGPSKYLKLVHKDGEQLVIFTGGVTNPFIFVKPKM